MTIKLKNILLYFILTLTIFVAFIIGIKNINASPGPGISISPEYPKEQIQKNGIFDVLFKQNKHYNLTLKIANTTNDNKTIIISPNTAYTSNSGNMTFDKSRVPNDSTKQYDFHSLFDQKERKITVPANTINEVNFGLKMPSKQYQGIIMGGFYVTIPGQENNDNNSNFKINNNFAYGLTTVIHNNEQIAQPKIKLNNVNTNNDNNVLKVRSKIQNTGAGLITNMNIKSEIIKSSNNQIITQSIRNNLSMAPNSSFNYDNIINNSLAPGQYKIKLNINDNNGHNWQESRNFNISTQNSATHFIRKVPWKSYIIIGVIAILIIIIAYLIYNQFKLKNKNNKNNNSKN